MRTISVVGHGAATEVADAAVMRVAAVHRARSLADALAGSESARRAVVAAAPGVEVSSTGLQVWPVHDQQGSPDGFEARHSLSIGCSSVEEVGALVTRLADEVGDQLAVDGVELVVSDPTSGAARAREAAMGDARARAEHLAALAGESLDRIVQVVEGGAAAPGPGQPGLLAKTVDVTFSPGATTISASVSVTWSLVD